MLSAYDRAKETGADDGPEGSSPAPRVVQPQRTGSPSGRQATWGFAVSSYDVLKRLLSDRPIAFHPALARAFGGINEALFFQQIAYWSDKGADPEWIYKTQADLEGETALARTQQENARRKLRALGVLEEQKRGVPARLYYRVNWEATFALLERFAQDAGNLQSRMRVSRNQDREKTAGKDAGNSTSISENTQRVQPERSFEASNGLSIVDNYDDDRLTLLAYAEDLARELADQAPLASSTTRLVKLFRGSGLDMDDFIDKLMLARRITQQRTPAIRTTRSDGGSGPKPKMAYMLAVLEDLLGQSLPATGTADD
jgi:hypothetical protein